VQLERQGKTNNLLSADELNSVCRLEDRTAKLLDAMMQKLGLSIRGLYRVLRVARTLADMEEAANVQQKHVAEALSYRGLDRSRQQQSLQS
jgi:magnesium chelatase family protein